MTSAKNRGLFFFDDSGTLKASGVAWLSSACKPGSQATPPHHVIGDNMKLTDDGLVIERPHSCLSGMQRIYRWGDYGLSLVNSRELHSYSFAWEAAVLKFDGDDSFELVYDSGLTTDVEVFDTAEEANDFIAEAAALFGSKP